MNGFEKPVILSLQEMFQLGTEGSSVNRAEFDFSAISVDDFSGFFNTLPNLIYKKCRNIRFCNDFGNAIEENPENNVSENDIRQYERSIRITKPGYPIYLAKIISKVLPKSKLLTNLEFDRISLSPQSFKEITNAIKKSRLKSIKFANLKIQDDDFQYFLSKISPYRLENIVIENCQITDKSSDAIQAFLERKPPAGASYPLRFADFVLTENQINDDPSTEKVQQSTSEKITVESLSIEENQPEFISNSQQSSQKITDENSIQEKDVDLPKVERKPKKKTQVNKTVFPQKVQIDQQNESPPFPDSKRSNKSVNEQEPKEKKNKKSLNKKPDKTLEQIRKATLNVKPASPSMNARVQNQNLKKELNELLRVIDAAQYDEDVFLVGDGAQESVSKIRKTEKMVNQFEATNGEISIQD